jgi:ATP-dependent helicase/DNAse subunit B
VAKKYVHNFLKSEEELLADDNNVLKIISLEEDYRTDLYIPDLNETVHIKGQIDRIDQLNGEVRIIDYKTGKVEQGNLNIGNLEKLRDEKHHKAIQLLIYAILAISSGKIDADKTLVAGNISFKNLKAGLLLLNFAEPRKKHINEITKERLETFQEILKSIVKDLANEKSFVENLEAKY